MHLSTYQECPPSSESVAPSKLLLTVICRAGLAIAALVVIGLLVWCGLAVRGAPNPVVAHTSPGVAIVDIGILVFREGLECILVLSAVTAGLAGNGSYRQPVAAGAGIAFLATVVTWFIAVGIVHDLSTTVSALNLQVITGLLAIVVLLVVMNWFFHKVYWGGWISMHNRRKKALLSLAQGDEISNARLMWGLGLLGFSSFYREGFEVVLFLQSYNLRLGGRIVLAGASLGLALSSVVAVLTFLAHQRLPYRKMLVLTGLLLGGVLLVMVGEQAQEMQQAGWISATPIAPLAKVIPSWLGLWFSIFPTFETLGAQAFAAILVVGSYVIAQQGRRRA